MTFNFFLFCLNLYAIWLYPLQRGKTFSIKESSFLGMTVRFQFCRVLLCCYFSLVQSDLEWSYLLGSYLFYGSNRCLRFIHMTWLCTPFPLQKKTKQNDTIDVNMYGQLMRFLNLSVKNDPRWVDVLSKSIHLNV